MQRGVVKSCVRSAMSLMASEREAPVSCPAPALISARILQSCSFEAAGLFVRLRSLGTDSLSVLVTVSSVSNKPLMLKRATPYKAVFQRSLPWQQKEHLSPRPRSDTRAPHSSVPARTTAPPCWAGVAPGLWLPAMFPFEMVSRLRHSYDP